MTVAYGVRNFEHLDQGYAEMARVLRPGGILCVIELAVPTNPVVRPLYNLYTSRIIPTLGRLVSSDTRAYTYLPESIAAMPQGERMLDMMRHACLTSPASSPHLRHLRHLHRPQTLTPPPLRRDGDSIPSQ